MTLYASLVSIVMVVVAAGFVAMPFFNPESTADGGATDGSFVLRAPGARQMFERQKVDAYSAIKEAEFDYQMGKVGENEAVLDRAGLAFVRIADDIFFGPWLLADQLPFRFGGKSRAAQASKA